MQFSSTFLPLLAMALPTSAIINGLIAPKNVTAGSSFTLTLQTSDYIQRVYDVSAAFGIAPGKGAGGSLGVVFASAYLGPQLSNIVMPIDFTVSVDESTPKGESIIAAAVTSLWGVGMDPLVSTFNTTVNII
jgi:hypothetical protein